jgi:ABC-2 type transport system permease protein
MNTRAFPILIRRELWEHRVLWMGPLVFAGLFLLVCITLGGALISSIQVKDPHSLGLTGGSGSQAFIATQVASTALLYFLMSIVVFAYLADCLYAERKDRSILFWKSLPVSDAQTVLSKLVVALILVPIIVYVVTVVANVLVFLVLSVWVRGNSLFGPYMQWDTLTWLKLQGTMLASLPVLILWYAPIAAYQLLISAWAKSNAMLWTVLPPIALSIGERMTFGTWHIGQFILGWFLFDPPGSGAKSDSAWSGMGFASFRLLTSPALWIGVAVAAALIFATIRIRRQRDDS